MNEYATVQDVIDLWRPLSQDEQTKAKVKQQVAEYHRYYDLIHTGDLYRLICPWDNPFCCAWSFVSRDQNETLVTLVCMRHEEQVLFHLKLQGLDPEKRYQLEGTDEIYSGALLMYAGVDVSERADRDGDSLKLHFTAIG